MRDILLVCRAGLAVRLECRVVGGHLCDPPKAAEALLLDKQPRVEVIVRLLGARV